MKPNLTYKIKPTNTTFWLSPVSGARPEDPGPFSDKRGIHPVSVHCCHGVGKLFLHHSEPCCLVPVEGHNVSFSNNHETSPSRIITQPFPFKIRPKRTKKSYKSIVIPYLILFILPPKYKILNVKGPGYIMGLSTVFFASNKQYCSWY